MGLPAIHFEIICDAIPLAHPSTLNRPPRMAVEHFDTRGYKKIITETQLKITGKKVPNIVNLPGNFGIVFRDESEGLRRFSGYNCVYPPFAAYGQPPSAVWFSSVNRRAASSARSTQPGPRKRQIPFTSG
jgi:hypothetical protein